MSASPQAADLTFFTGVEPRIWLFDFDNTLVALEREVDWAASRVELERFLRNQGVDERIFAEIPKGNLPLYEALWAHLLDDGMGTAIDDYVVGGRAHTNPRQLMRCASTIIEAYELRGVERATELPGAMALLRCLRERNSAIAVVTSNSSHVVRRWLQREQLTGYIDLIVGRDAQLPLKPAPESLLYVLKASSTSFDQAIFVGDSRADADAASAAEIRFLGIATTVENREILLEHNALAVFASPLALAEELKSLAHSPLIEAERLT